MDLRNQVGRLSGGSDGEAVEEPSAEDLTGALVVWKLATATPFYASVRYRCLFPLIGLSELGVQPLVLSDRETISDFGRVRSEERRVGKECVSTCRSRWSPDH